MKPRRMLNPFTIAFAALASLLVAGYGYVYVAGAPQLDRPKVATPQEMQAEGLSFQVVSFDSPALGQTRNYGVILPPGYNQHPEQHYPVIVLLHGGHDDERAFFDKYAIASVLGDLYKSGQLPPSIIITPDGNDNRGSSPLRDPDYFDGPHGKVSTWIGSELVSTVKQNYRTLEGPVHWAIGGVSSGGWGAANIGLRHLDNFGIFLSHMGYFTDDSGPQNSPNKFIGALPRDRVKQLRFYIDGGENDIDLLASTKEFHQTLNRLGVPNVFYAFPGGHGVSGPDNGWNYFHKHLYQSLAYVGEQFQSARQ